MGARVVSGAATLQRRAVSSVLVGASEVRRLTWKGRRVGNLAAAAAEVGIKPTTYTSYRVDRPNRDGLLNRAPGPVRYSSCSGEWGTEARDVTLTHPDTGEQLYDLDVVRQWGASRAGLGWRRQQGGQRSR